MRFDYDKYNIKKKCNTLRSASTVIPSISACKKALFFLPVVQSCFFIFIFLFSELVFDVFNSACKKALFLFPLVQFCFL